MIQGKNFLNKTKMQEPWRKSLTLVNVTWSYIFKIFLKTRKNKLEIRIWFLQQVQLIKKLVSQTYNIFLQIYKKKVYINNNNTEIGNKWVFKNDQYTCKTMLNFSSIHGTVIWKRRKRKGECSYAVKSCVNW